jgi:hypothetical protein
LPGVHAHAPRLSLVRSAYRQIVQSRTVLRRWLHPNTCRCAPGVCVGATRRDRLRPNYASDQFEAACYTALVSEATQVGHADVAHPCEQNPAEDRVLGAWILQQLS